ncbi:MAG: UDP-N-acetylmuramate dehydrogenase [Azoarcus sp.]|jgi:UDP-N-acetylmuramate dehydrogenase|nr:UDP-N-acetylmuramate dehydrogenase [Azoarcus sp.]
MIAEKLDADLAPLNTFGLPARAARLLRVTTAEDARAVIEEQGENRIALVLGGGSNLVLRGGKLGTVLKVEIAGREKIGETHDAIVVEAGAGENWHDFVRWTLKQGWLGLENLTLIPGTVGAAPVQNIGAYGLEVGERIESVHALDMTSGEARVFDAAACRFGYRDSIFKREPGRWLVTSVRFRLPRVWLPRKTYKDIAEELTAQGIIVPTPLQLSDVVAAIRQRKLPDPAKLGSAGSFFKNPVVAADRCAALLAEHPTMPHYPQPDGSEKLAAGWLIDRCGWRGRRLGPVGCYENQALVLVNYGGAIGADVMRLADHIKLDVRARFGVELEPEPVFV